MSTDPRPERPDASSSDTSGSDAATAKVSLAPRFTRASVTWVAVGTALVLLIVLIVFMLQNSTEVDVHFLGWDGTIGLGVALLIAAVGGGVVVAVAGIARITQLRANVRRSNRGGAGRS